MRFRPLKRFSTDDYPDAPSWFEDFLDALNPMVDSINPLVASNIDLDNNILGERQVVTLSHNTPITLRMKTLKFVPRFVRVGYAGGYIGVGAITGYNDDGTVIVTVFFVGTAPTTTVSTQLYFEP